MAETLDTLLEPGERVLLRARHGVLNTLLQWLWITGFVAVGYALLGRVSGNGGVLSVSSYTPYLGVGMISLFAAYVLLARGEALLTDRRLLFREGLLLPRTSTIALVEIVRVRGLAEGSPRPVFVAGRSGEILFLHDLPRARAVGRAVAEAAGLPLPSGPAPLAERAARVVIVALSSGVLIGALLGFLAPFLAIVLGFHAATLGAFATGLVLAPVTVGLGIALGWLAGASTAFLRLRPLVPADELRPALVVDLELPGASFPADDIRRIGRPLLFRLASLVYGRRFEAPSREGSEDRVR